ncbi:MULTISPECIES: endolytic transglycosylase MltG [Streptomyces]|uniref:endolytic transglycosylase MltG n=1 Tax=Streptomyces TaxID=1883 RepID=UPI00167A0ABE|nr:MULTISPECIES: endolytic transglycosylase MltG [Streptomyces]MBK3525174.1 endolytic transglycosylase MltG [Streptomyces sp. MBT70]
MQTNTPPRNTLRLTRRGRLVTLVAGAVAAGTAVAVPLLLLAGDRDEAGSASLVIPEGWRASQVYDAVDKALRLPPGSTRKSLGKAALKLPGEAQGNPEGYLFPATYPIPEGATPESLLRTMVDTANDKYGLAPVTAGAQRNAMNLHQAVTVASIVQAEADTKADMGKIARVILNRLARGMPLQMDSTVSYALEHDPAQAGQGSGQVQSPYNSYQRMGLPPTPIDNPGADAMRAALNPTPGDWLYCVTVRPGDTRFTADYDEHLRNVAEFHAVHQSAAPAQPDGGVPWSSSSPVPAQPSGG